MEEPKKGKRTPEHEKLYQTSAGNTLIEPDRVSPAIEGYFRIPAVWIGTVPAPGEVGHLNPPVHHEIKFQKKLSCGIEVRVQRDGLFLFDFSKWHLAPIVTIPGYTRPGFPCTPTTEHAAAAEKAEDFAVFRAQVMNVHQACLTTAEHRVKRRSAMMGFPVTAWNTYKAISFNVPPPYHDDTEDIHALAQNVLNNKYGVKRDRPLSRRVLELEVVEESFKILNEILVRNESSVVQLVEAAYISACRSRDKRFGESVVVGWTVCEQLISLLWKTMIDPVDAQTTSATRLSKQRRSKLLSRDYTASVMVEMLEVNGRIDNKLYELLETARKARNKWAHEMKVPTQNDVYSCQRAVQNLLKLVLNIELSHLSGGRGGVPQWPLWMWNMIESDKQTNS